MSALRLFPRAARAGRTSLLTTRSFTTSIPRLAGPGNAKEHPNTGGHRDIQTEKPLGPHMTNTNSTVANEMPSVGAKKAPPELISSVDPDFVPKDSVPENTERMTGGTQKGAPEEGENAKMGTKEDRAEGVDGEMDVGEFEGAKFKVEPLRRTGEDANTMRARLLYQSRKRGTLESDLLMSTFADRHLEHMSMAQMRQYDLFLDENDWDIYYWATQQAPSTSQEYAEGAAESKGGANAQAAGKDMAGQAPETDAWRNGAPRSGEWAQTVGTFKPAYRPVPKRWQNSEILAMLRRHVVERSAGGVHEAEAAVEGEGVTPSGKGMAFMPPIRNMDQAA